MRTSVSRKIFIAFNLTIMFLLCMTCILPFLNLLAMSFSGSYAAQAGEVIFWPVDFTLEAYRFLLEKNDFWRAFLISVLRTVAGTLFSLFVCVLAAYALSRQRGEFSGKKYYIWMLYVSLFFAGGLVPLYLTLSWLRLIDSYLSLILPTAVSPWNIVLLVNLFRQNPRSLEEAAKIDGANQFKILWSVVLPISKAAIATVTLFTAVAHWNSWLDALVYMNSPDKFPLQTYIYTMLNLIKYFTQNPSADNAEALKALGEANLRAAQIFLAMLPIMLVYPFVQRFFIKGLMLGSVKE